MLTVQSHKYYILNNIYYQLLTGARTQTHSALATRAPVESRPPRGADVSTDNTWIYNSAVE